MTRKKRLVENNARLRDRLGRCEVRVLRLQEGISAFLAAEHVGEMGNRDKAIEHLEALVEGVRPK